MKKREKELLLDFANRYIAKNYCLQRDNCYGCDFEGMVVPCEVNSDTLDDIRAEEVLQIIEKIEPEPEQPSYCPCCGSSLGDYKKERSILTEKDIMRDISIKELLSELIKRQGVETTIAEPYQDAEVKVNGPAIIAIVTDWRMRRYA